MKTYVKFLINKFLESFLKIFLIMLSLVFVLNILKEIEFLNNIDIDFWYPIYLSLLNSPSIIFEMLPFIFLLTTQFFFIKLFNNDEIQIFKYSGLKNTVILKLLGLLTFFMGLLIITLFYNLSSKLQNHYLQLKNQFSKNDEYLAVINKNGLWIKDIVNNEINIINSSKIDNNFLINTFITKFNKNYEIIQNIKSEKIDIKNKKWLIHDGTVFENNTSKKIKLAEFNSNFDLKKIESLFSNLSSLSIIKLVKLRENYKLLNYSIVEVDMQIYKIITYPIYLTLMTILAAITMFNTKKIKKTTVKITIGLFLSVIIYYIINFFNVMGVTEKISLITAICVPFIMLTLANILMIFRINEK
jgi:lipopolysaccharide export system permease protein